MTDLAQWLLAQIAEDEAVAQAAGQGPWHWEGDKGHHGTYRLATTDPEPEVPEGNEWTAYYDAWERRTVADGTACDDYGAQVAIADTDAAHIARWDPARVLAECAAKRAIVEVHDQVHECPGGPNLVSDPDLEDGDYGGACQTLRHLAAVYSDRDGYDPAWAPE